MVLLLRQASMIHLVLPFQWPDGEQQALGKPEWPGVDAALGNPVPVNHMQISPALCHIQSGRLKKRLPLVECPDNFFCIHLVGAAKQAKFSCQKVFVWDENYEGGVRFRHSYHLS